MAKSATRSSFGFDKSSPPPTSPASSLSSSPPTSFRTPKSRLPIRNPHGSLTPGSGQSGSTATRVALTSIVNRNTPSPHPLPDDSLQVKLMSIYGRVESPAASKPNTPATSPEINPLEKLAPGTEGDQHREAAAGTIQHYNETGEIGKIMSNVGPHTSPSPSDATTQESSTTITLTPDTPSRTGKAQIREESKTSVETNSINARNPLNFSHPARANRARHSLGGSSIHSTTPSEPDLLLPSTVTISRRDFPVRTTSHQALTTEALSKSSPLQPSTGYKNFQSSIQSSSTEYSPKNDSRSDSFRTVRLSLKSDSSFVGPTLRISEDADHLLMGGKPRQSSGRLRLPSFGTTSSDESEIKAAEKLGNEAKARRIHDDYTLTKRQSYHEQQESTSSNYSTVNTSDNSGTRAASSNTSDSSHDDSKPSTIRQLKSFRERQPSPHTALLFNRTMTSSALVDKPMTPRGLPKSKTSPNIIDSSPPGVPPLPPPKDVQVKNVEPTIHLVDTMKQTDSTITKPSPQPLVTGLRMRKQRLPEPISPVRPSAFVEHNFGSISGDCNLGYAKRFEQSISSTQPAPISRVADDIFPVQSEDLTTEKLVFKDNHSWKSSSLRSTSDAKKLPRSTSKPRLLPHIRSLFHRRSNNDVASPSPMTSIPELKHGKPAIPALSPLRFTTSTTPTSSTTGWVPSSTPTPSSPTKGFRNKKTSAPNASARPPTRGKVAATTETCIGENDTMKRATALAMQLTNLATMPNANSSSAPTTISSSLLIPLARTLVSTITAARDAESASIAAQAKAEEARLCWEGCQTGVGECLRLVEAMGVGK